MTRPISKGGKPRPAAFTNSLTQRGALDGPRAGVLPGGKEVRHAEYGPDING